MAFFMRFYAKQKLSNKANLRELLLLLMLILLPTALVQAKNFHIESVETQHKKGVYLLNAHVNFAFSEEAQEALQSGVPIIILLDIRLEEERSWWWDKTIAEMQQGYLLLYHALTEKYIVNHLNSGAQDDYTSLETTLSALGQISNLPLIDSSLLDKDSNYLVKLRVRLDIESLPAPMRPLAYLSSNWHLASDWYTWPLQH